MLASHPSQQIELNSVWFENPQAIQAYVIPL